MKIKVNCNGCHQPIEIAAPELEIFNAAHVSSIVVGHRFSARCENCRKPVILQVLGVQLNVIAVPMEPQEKSPIILPSNGHLGVDPARLKV